jgi:hypothetical protein
MKSLPRLLDRRTRITAADIDLGLLTGSWRAMVMPKDGGVDRSAWVFCVLTALLGSPLPLRAQKSLAWLGQLDDELPPAP